MLSIADWPAIHRQFTAPLPQTGEKDSPYPVETIFTTTAIAAGEQIIRFDTVLAPEPTRSWQKLPFISLAKFKWRTAIRMRRSAT